MAALYREFTEQAQIDAEYNPSLKVADPAAEMRHYVERSALNVSAATGIPVGKAKQLFQAA